MKMRFTDRMLLCVLVFYLMFGYSAQVVTIGGIPMAEIVIAFGGMIYLKDILAKKMDKGTKIASIAILVSGLYAAIKLSFDIDENGFFAIRDASHYIEMFAFFVGYGCVLRNPSLDWGKLTRRFFWIMALYFCFYFLKAIAPGVVPEVSNPHGETVSLLSYVAFPSVMFAVGFASLIRSPAVMGGGRKRALVAFFAIILAVQLFQARILYFQLFACLIVGIYLRPRWMLYAPYMLLASLALLVVMAPLGQEFGRLGVSLDIDTLGSHFLSILGIEEGPFAASASGVDLRFEWWRDIFNKLMATPYNLTFGLGFGMPLTPFEITGGIAVREVHNSVISIAGRQGVFGLSIVGLIWAVLAVRIAATMMRIKRRVQQHDYVVVTISLFLINTWIFSTAEDAFEKPCFAFPFYMLAGILFALTRRTGSTGAVGARNYRVMRLGAVS